MGNRSRKHKAYLKVLTTLSSWEVLTRSKTTTSMLGCNKLTSRSCRLHVRKVLWRSGRAQSAPTLAKQIGRTLFWEVAQPKVGSRGTTVQPFRPPCECVVRATTVAGLCTDISLLQPAGG